MQGSICSLRAMAIKALEKLRIFDIALPMPSLGRLFLGVVFAWFFRRTKCFKPLIFRKKIFFCAQSLKKCCSRKKIKHSKFSPFCRFGGGFDLSFWFLSKNYLFRMNFRFIFLEKFLKMVLIFRQKSLFLRCEEKILRFFSCCKSLILLDFVIFKPFFILHCTKKACQSGASFA